MSQGFAELLEMMEIMAKDYAVCVCHFAHGDRVGLSGDVDNVRKALPITVIDIVKGVNASEKLAEQYAKDNGLQMFDADVDHDMHLKVLTDDLPCAETYIQALETFVPEGDGCAVGILHMAHADRVGSYDNHSMSQEHFPITKLMDCTDKLTATVWAAKKSRELCIPEYNSEVDSVEHYLTKVAPINPNYVAPKTDPLDAYVTSEPDNDDVYTLFIGHMAHGSKVMTARGDRDEDNFALESDYNVEKVATVKGYYNAYAKAKEIAKERKIALYHGDIDEKIHRMKSRQVS